LTDGSCDTASHSIDHIALNTVTELNAKYDHQATSTRNVESTLLHRPTSVGCKQIRAEWGSNSTGLICYWNVLQTNLQ